MSWGTVSIGRMTLRENYTISHQRNAATGEVTIQINGLEFTDLNRVTPRTFAAALDDFRRVEEDILGLAGEVVPVLFSNKSNFNGYYRVQDTGAQVTDWPGEAASFTWNLILTSFGADNAVDIESRLGTVARLNAFALPGERWHAPAIGHYSYYTGVAPTSMVRATEEGNITVYRAIPSVNPLWGCPVASMSLGRARVKVGGFERTGTGIRAGTTTWELSNGLVRVTPEPTPGVLTTLHVAAWTGGAWRDKVWDLRVAGSIVEPALFRGATVIRNNYAMVTLRLLAAHPSDGTRVLVDLTLRRGSRFLEGFVQRVSAGEISLVRDTVEAQTDNTAASGYVVATANDADGNQFIAGSSKTCTAHVDGGIAKAATTTLDFYVGVVAAGTGAVTGDGATVLRDQYIGAVSETVTAVKR